MHDPYRAPDAQLVDRDPVVPPSRAPLVAGLVLSCFTALLLTVAVPRFGDMLLAFGSDLPWATWAVMRGYLLGWLLPLSIVAVWWRWPNLRQRAPIALGIGLVALLVVLPVSVMLIYLPVFKLAAVV